MKANDRVERSAGEGVGRTVKRADGRECRVGNQFYMLLRS